MQINIKTICKLMLCRLYKDRSNNRSINVYHKDWLTYSGGTDRPAELCYNFSISNDLTQIVNFPTRIPDCDSHRPALSDLFISSDPSICSTMVFPPLGILIMLLSQFPLTFQ